MVVLIKVIPRIGYDLYENRKMLKILAKEKLQQSYKIGGCIFQFADARDICMIVITVTWKRSSFDNNLFSDEQR